MSSYLLDTSIIIDYLRDKDEIVSRINDLDGELVSSYLCLAELYEGVYRATYNQKQIEEAITVFFQGLSEIFGLNKETAQQFGLLRAHLAKRGTIIEDIDLLIAATALSQNCILVTRNPKHFSRVKELQIMPL